MRTDSMDMNDQEQQFYTTHDGKDVLLRNDGLQNDYLLLAHKSLSDLNTEINEYAEDGYTLKGIQAIVESPAFAQSPIIYLATMERLIKRKSNDETI